MTEYTTTTDDALEQSPLLHDMLGDALAQLKVFHTKLRNEGELKGIIGPRDTGILWERHILNSAAIVPFILHRIPQQRQLRVADVGSGGGFPGLIAAACIPSVDFTLIEPMERRCLWLEECVEAMYLTNVSIQRARSDEVIQDIRHGDTAPFDVVTCRAVAPMRKLIPWTIPMLTHGGTLIALKGRSVQNELDKAKDIIKRYSGLHITVQLAPVGGDLEPTHVVIALRR